MGKTEVDGGAKRTPIDVANEIAEATDTDVLLYNGPISRGLDFTVIETCSGRTPRKHALLVLVTEGGDADAAFRIARCLQDRYENYTLFVTGWCKSAGTLIALGASALIVAAHGEMGPLDVQLSRRDELFESQSGLTVTTALSTLQREAFLAFEHFMLQTKLRGGVAITTHTAMEIASTMAVGLFSPVYAQVDPMHIGEAGRANKIAKQYGEMLIVKGQNSNSKNIDRLIDEYSSHGFVIDKQEASELFHRVREPNALESELAKRLGKLALWPISSPGEPRIAFLSSEKIQAAPDAGENSKANGESDVDVPGEVVGLAPDAAGSVASTTDGVGEPTHTSGATKPRLHSV